MNKQVITRQHIQRELLKKFKKVKPLYIFLTILTALAIPAHILLAIEYAKTGSLSGDRLFSATVFLFAGPVIILFFVILLLDFYYIDLYKAKKGKFRIVEEILYEKKKERIQYYRRSQEENSLYFRFTRVAVEDDVYAYSHIGDRFYIVVLRWKRGPRLVYHTHYYEIDQGQH